MRIRVAAITVLFGLVVLVASCGGGSSDSSAGSDGGSSGDASTTAASSGGDSGSSGGDVDCDAIKEAAQSLISIQLLAQLNSPENIAAVKDGTMGNLDPDQFVADMETLHALDTYGSSVFGDPKAAIDAYEDAGTQAKALFEADPPTQEAIDAYMASIGSTGEFLGHQAAIAGAMDAAGC